MTHEGVQQLVGAGCKSGTVVGFGRESRLRVLLDGYRTEIKFPASCWRIIDE